MSCIAVDAPVPEQTLADIRKIPGVHNVTAINITVSADPSFRQVATLPLARCVSACAICCFSAAPWRRVYLALSIAAAASDVCNFVNAVAPSIAQD